MKCHYDVLGVPRDAPFEDIKKSYRKLAIKWHPDKNLDNSAEATEQFQLIQQAFEVLGDPHERAWYDNHREAILCRNSGRQYEDDSLDVYEYFTASCYKGFGDDEKGFYSVYREVFNKIAAEDSEFNTNEDSDFEIPSFGKSDSPFDSVHAFYAYWQSYSTKKSYSWLDTHDAREAQNRRISRLLEKENKKGRDKARKARNEEVRELVGFVRKRDKRVQAHAKYLQEVAAEKTKKTEKLRLLKIKERNEQLSSYQESEWSKFSNVEKELKDIEASLAAEFGETCSEENSTDEDSVVSDSLYCIACNKLFKTSKAFENHESSKKHKENVQLIKENMSEDDLSYNDLGNVLDDSDDEDVIPNECNDCEERDDSTPLEGSDCKSENGHISVEKEGLTNKNDLNTSSLSDNFEENIAVAKKKKKSKKLLKNKKHCDSVSEESDADIDLLGQSKKQRRKQQQQKMILEEKSRIGSKETECNSKDKISTKEDEETCVLGNLDQTNFDVSRTQKSINGVCEESSSFPSKTAGSEKKESSKKSTKINDTTCNNQYYCKVCNSIFPSKNKLFQHLEKTGHAVYLQGKASENLDTKKGTSKNSKRKMKK